MLDPLSGKNIGLGVTGSIACYKAVGLASELVKAGANVDVMMTENATRFVSPLTFNSITHRPVLHDIFDPESEISMDHVAVAHRLDVVIIAPATANTLAKLAAGLSNDVLTTTLLATKAPVLIAPAMDANMYEHPTTQRNVDQLKSMGYSIVGPNSGRLASGLTGLGRLLETWELTEYIRIALGQNGDMANRKIVVSAGGTKEPIDPVRVISNRSTGKMGYAIAKAVRDRGGKAVLISATGATTDPVGIRVAHVETAEQMHKMVSIECEDADTLIMAAAVSDWRVSSYSEQKIKKDEIEHLSIDFVKNLDILTHIAKNGLIKVGFAAESEDLQLNAQKKLTNKKLDLIVANDITQKDSGFATDDNQVTLIDRHGSIEELPLLSKYQVAHKILDRVSQLFYQ